MSLLDVLTLAFNPTQLTPSEVSLVRSVFAERGGSTRDDRPWESGVVDREPAAGHLTEVESLRRRVVDLEIALKVMGDLLVESGALAPNAIATRLESVERQLEAREAAAEEREREGREAERAAIEARTVICAACGATVRQRDTFMSGKGPLCAACHAEREG